MKQSSKIHVAEETREAATEITHKLYIEKSHDVYGAFIQNILHELGILRFSRKFPAIHPINLRINGGSRN